MKLKLPDGSEFKTVLNKEDVDMIIHYVLNELDYFDGYEEDKVLFAIGRTIHGFEQMLMVKRKKAN